MQEWTKASIIETLQDTLNLVAISVAVAETDLSKEEVCYDLLSLIKRFEALD